MAGVSRANVKIRSSQEQPESMMSLRWNRDSSTISSGDLTWPYSDQPVEQPVGISDNRTTNGSSRCIALLFEGVIPWDNPDSMVSAHTENLVRGLKEKVILPLLFLIGGPANVMNMAVFYKQGLKERINVCLFSLALADFLYLFFNVVFFGEQIPLYFTTKERYGPVGRFMVNHNLLAFYGFNWLSQVMSAIIASERCFCVLQPLRSRTVMQTSTTITIIVIIGVLLVGLCSIVTTRYRVVCAYDPLTASDSWVVVPTQFYLDNREFVESLDAFVFGVGTTVVIVVIVTVTTAVTMIKLRQAAAWRAGTSSTSRLSAQEIALTMMLVYNTIFFIVCAVPPMLFRVVKTFIPEVNAGRRQHNLFFTSIWLGDMMSFINSTFNIIFYYTMGSRYRHIFWQLLGRKKKTDS